MIEASKGKESLEQFVSSSTADQFKEKLVEYSLSDIAEIFYILSKQPTMELKSKENSLLEYVDSSDQFELLAKELTSLQFLSFLEVISRHPSFKEKLSLLLVGLQPKVFLDALHSLTSQHLNLLKQESLLEPLQFQLLQFAHLGEELESELETEIIHFNQDLQSVDIGKLTQTQLQSYDNKIKSLKNRVLVYLESASTALSLAWNSNRPDLIEKVSLTHEKLQHLLMSVIGHSSFQEKQPTGLYQKLQDHFSEIYTSSLKNDEPVLDGLTRLGIWHLQDYWQLGLLPSIAQIEELDLNLQQNNKEGKNYREFLQNLIQENLKSIGLNTVGDLKKEQIFSQSLLKNYIEKFLW